MNQMKSETKEVATKLKSNCNVNMMLNFTVGGVAIVVALLIGYLIYLYW